MIIVKECVRVSQCSGSNPGFALPLMLQYMFFRGYEILLSNKEGFRSRNFSFLPRGRWGLVANNLSFEWVSHCDIIEILKFCSRPNRRL